jgi:hypothetical protein
MVTVLTADEILWKGLVLVGYNCRCHDKVLRATNLGRFRAHYGSNPVVYAQISQSKSQPSRQTVMGRVGMERLLWLDMDDGKDKSLKPIDLYQSQKEYSENYTLNVFRKHIDQEQQPRKMLAYYATKNNNTHLWYRRHITPGLGDWFCFEEPTTTSPGIWMKEKVRTDQRLADLLVFN